MKSRRRLKDGRHATDNSRMFQRRVRMLFVMLTLFFGVISVRLFHLQVITGAPLGRELTEIPMECTRLDAPRGRLLDRFGRELAVDKIGFQISVDYLYIDPAGERLTREIKRRTPAGKGRDKALAERLRAETLAEVEQFWVRLAGVTGYPREQLETARARVRRSVQRTRAALERVRGSIPELAEERLSHPILTGVSREVAIAVAAAVPPLPGVTARPIRQRYYPYGDVAPHIIGVTGPVSETRVKAAGRWSPNNPRGYTDGDWAGREGLEHTVEDRLRPRFGWVMRPAAWAPGFARHDPARTQQGEPAPGQDVSLTLDIELQERLEELLDRRGALVVLDVETGGVLGMATWPRYDLNNFREPEIYRSLTADTENRPLVNRAMSAYAPGSTVKPVLGLAALQAGAVREGDRLTCSGRWPGGGGFSCWIYRQSRGAHGPASLAEAIRWSCNHYFFHAVARTGGAVASDWYMRFGLGRRTGIELPGESAGFVPTEDWLLRRAGHGWTASEARLISIGQGAMLATPLQMADVAATIARGGVRIRPHLVADHAAIREDLGLLDRHVAAVKQAMRDVVEARDGLAHKTVRVPGVRVAGKTGSAQVWQFRDGQMSEADPHCWFMGWAEVNSRAVAFSVMLENVPGGSGGSSAGPLARQIVEACRDLGHLGSPSSTSSVRQLAAPPGGRR